MENVRDRIDVRLANSEKYYSKCTSKPSYMSHQIFDNNLASICKVVLKLNKPAYIGMCIFELSNVRIPL